MLCRGQPVLPVSSIQQPLPLPLPLLLCLHTPIHHLWRCRRCNVIDLCERFLMLHPVSNIIAATSMSHFSITVTDRYLVLYSFRRFPISLCIVLFAGLITIHLGIISFFYIFTSLLMLRIPLILSICLSFSFSTFFFFSMVLSYVEDGPHGRPETLYGQIVLP